MRESHSFGGLWYHLRGPASRIWATMLALFEVAGKMPTFWCVWVNEPARERLDDWETRDSWLNWSVHLGTKNLSKNNLLDFEPHISPKKYVFFFSQWNFVGGYVIEAWTELTMWNCYFMAYCPRNLKTGKRFKNSNPCCNFLKSCDIINMNQVLISRMMGGWGCPLKYKFLSLKSQAWFGSARTL